MNVAIVLDLLLRLVASADKIGQLISVARNEGRDITADELKALAADDDTARAELEAAIKRAESGL